MRMMRIACNAIVPALGVALTVATAAYGQLICGDANGNGTVDISDGVQVLRAAAFLSNVCTPEACNVNGVGQIDVADGVLVLRKAVSLPITESCPGIEQTIKSLIETALATIGYAATGAATTGAQVAAVQSESCTDGGTLQYDTSNGVFTFVQCREEDVVANGTIGTVGNTLAFNLMLTDLVTDETLHISDEVVVTDGPQGSTTVNGTLAFSSSVAGDFDLAFSSVNFTVDSNDQIVVMAGTLIMNEGSGSGDLEAVRRLELRLNAGSTDVIRVIAMLDTGVERTFDFNIQTSELTEI